MRWKKEILMNCQKKTENYKKLEELRDKITIYGWKTKICAKRYRNSVSQ